MSSVDDMWRFRWVQLQATNHHGTSLLMLQIIHTFVKASVHINFLFLNQKSYNPSTVHALQNPAISETLNLVLVCLEGMGLIPIQVSRVFVGPGCL
jgi:hypothetical protein